MSDFLRVRIHGDEEADRDLRLFELLLSDLRPFWPLVVPIATGWWRRQFETEGAFAGIPWARLSSPYRLVKERLHPGRGILVATGEMKRAASRPRRTATARSLILEIEDEKLGYHQEGTSRMPARPLVFGSPLPAAAARELDLAAERYVTDFLRRRL